MNIAFFDFDNTLVKGDSLFPFLRFYHRGKSIVFLLKLSQFLPVFLAYKLKIISRHRAKQKLFILFFKGENKSDFIRKSQEFSKFWIPLHLIAENWQLLLRHQSAGDKIVIVSASVNAYLQPFSEKYHFDLISTEMDLANEILSGKFTTANCYGKEKKIRILESYCLSDFQKSYAYGDSDGDNEMLSIVDFPTRVSC